MANIPVKEITPASDWQTQLSEAISDPDELLSLLGLSDHPRLRQGKQARRLFPLRVPRGFVKRMEAGNENDPLLRQVITAAEEFIETPGFTTDPLEEHNGVLPGLLHKYHNRALLVVKGGCAIHCRYCFRRHFPYSENNGNKVNWRNAIAYIRANPQIDEIIFSGGDPLMAKDHELAWLADELQSIPHIKRLRIHSRLAVVIPARITARLCRMLAATRLQAVMVTHINHANEIDAEVAGAMARLRDAGVTLLNQSVLLRGVNDNASVLAALSDRLFNVGILPYYLFALDKVKGAAHFMLDDDEARGIVGELFTKVSGYLVPRLTREIGGEPSKTPLEMPLAS
ncbi:EF-P beta-lysylation protein EpmB [Acerihabitans arboris]|uniref:L-lysine 2,3-aminomutase n=1 Tax=Acerihabitans arboris TaxID=2691583 RepID=A0A845SM11_9GAMM|nr:EF-P beta-lysylation protein EpmB [Acerihabitans arboris]NDL64004.1 EF-P beta-lysylation protein EpmB [Acerihabitans arboris]